MNQVLAISLSLIVAIIALPQVTETIYSPALPELSLFFKIPAAQAEHTLTIYLFGFAFGVLFWGNLSDRIGRKAALLIAFFMYLIASFGCWLSPSIDMFMMMRFCQAFGGSAGSVLGQAILRDACPASERVRVFSIIGFAMAFSPALGPLMGGNVSYIFGWHAVFLLLILLGSALWIWVYKSLPETNLYLGQGVRAREWCIQAIKILKDPFIWIYAAFVGGANGIVFSFFAEGPFYFITILNVQPQLYGWMSMFLVIPFLLGSFFSKILNKKGYEPYHALLMGVLVMIVGFGGLKMFLICFSGPQQGLMTVSVSLGFIMLGFLGVAVVIPNSISQALRDYQANAGQAGSIFGGIYYGLIAMATYFMGIFHNGTLNALPTYLMGISFLMLSVWILHRKLRTCRS